MRKKTKKILINIFRVIAVAAPFIWILSKIQGDLLLNAISQIHWWTVPLFLLTTVVAIFLQGVRWWILLRAFSKDLAFLQTIAYHFSSLFYSLVLPNGTAQEVIRTLFVSKKAGATVSWSTAWIYKIIGLFVSFAFSVYGLIKLSDSGISKPIFSSAFAFFIGLCVLLTISFSKKLTSPLRKTATKLIPIKYLSKAESLREGIYQFRNKKFCLIVVSLITIIVQFLVIMGASIIMKGITGSFYFFECIAFIPLIEIISMAQPLTPNGIGVRDALVSLMFKHLQLSSEQLGIYILISNLAILTKFLGAIPVLHEMISRAKKKAEGTS